MINVGLQCVIICRRCTVSAHHGTRDPDPIPIMTREIARTGAGPARLVEGFRKFAVDLRLPDGGCPGTPTK